MTSHEKRTLVVKFGIEGNLRFLSHQETMALWSRAMARSGIDVCYSSGYNPHPRFSLPLPRSVGVRSDDELLSAQIWAGEPVETHVLSRRMQDCLPEGCVVKAVELYDGKTSFQATAAVYEFALRSPRSPELARRVSSMNATIAEAGAIVVRRQMGDGGRTKELDVRPYLLSAELAEGRARVHCRVGPAGTVRVDEMMQLLGLGVQDLSAAVARTSVQWERN